MLKERIITAVILGVVLLAILFYVPFQAFVWLALVIFGYSAYEWSKLAEIKSLNGQLGYALGSVVIGAGLYFQVLDGSLWTIKGQLSAGNKLVMAVASVWWLISAALVMSFPKGGQIWQSSVVIKGIFGYLTIIPAWLALITLREWHSLLNELHGALLALFVFAICWAADIGAYFSGKNFGKHKLMPRVSPGKTLEGFVGGLVGVIVLTLIVLYSAEVDVANWLTLTVCCLFVGIISAFGDLSESMLKRNAGLKDSGNILPGHGGLLDRIDSLTAAMPVFVLLFSQFYL